MGTDTVIAVGAMATVAYLLTKLQDERVAADERLSTAVDKAVDDAVNKANIAADQRMTIAVNNANIAADQRMTIAVNNANIAADQRMTIAVNNANIAAAKVHQDAQDMMANAQELARNAVVSLEASENGVRCALEVLRASALHGCGGGAGEGCGETVLLDQLRSLGERKRRLVDLMARHPPQVARELVAERSHCDCGRAAQQQLDQRPEWAAGPDADRYAADRCATSRSGGTAALVHDSAAQRGRQLAEGRPRAPLIAPRMPRALLNALLELHMVAGLVM
jgi:hypothetical protein